MSDFPDLVKKYSVTSESHLERVICYKLIRLDYKLHPFSFQTQVPVGNHRLDLVIFINNEPRVVFEIKSPLKSDFWAQEATVQIENYYRLYPDFFKTVNLLIVTNGFEGMCRSMPLTFKSWLKLSFMSKDLISFFSKDKLLLHLFFGLDYSRQGKSIVDSQKRAKNLSPEQEQDDGELLPFQVPEEIDSITVDSSASPEPLYKD